MVDITEEMSKKMMAGTAYESIELDEADFDDSETQKSNPKPKTVVREFTEEEKNRLGQMLRKKYSDRTMTDYIDCYDYLSSKTKHLANAKQAKEKLRSQALTYMQSVMDPEKRKTLPKDILNDVAQNGQKFIERFGYDDDGATNPITMKFRDWMDRNKDKLQQLQNTTKTVSENEGKKIDIPAKKSVLDALWNEKETIKVSSFLLGFGGACFGAIAGGVPGAFFGCGCGAVAGAGLVSAIVGIETNNAYRKAKKAAKAQEKALQKQNQQEKTQKKTKESKINLDEVGFWSKMITGCSVAGAGISGFMAYAAAHATAAGVAGSAAAITTSICTGAVVGALAVPAMVVTYKIGSWLKEKAANIADRLKSRKQEKTLQKQAEKAKTKEVKKTKSFDKSSVMDTLHAAGFVAGLSGLVGASAAVIGQAYPVGAGISVPVWAGVAAAVGLGATAVAAGVYKVSSWMKGKFDKSAESNHVKNMDAQDLSKVKEHTEQKIRNAENKKGNEAQKQNKDKGYKGKVSNASLKKANERGRVA